MTTTTTTTTTSTTTTTTTIDFSVAKQTILDEFMITESYLADKTRTMSVYCNETSNLAIKFKQFDTTARFTLTAHNDNEIFSKTL